MLYLVSTRLVIDDFAAGQCGCLEKFKIINLNFTGFL
jgi:hypothetical protein